jgi:hypothetical protein
MVAQTTMDLQFSADLRRVDITIRGNTLDRTNAFQTVAQLTYAGRA